MTKPKSVDEYIANSPEEIQPKLRELRKIIKSSLPKSAVEKISYAMPYYGYKGRVVYFAAWGDHIGFYTMISNIEAHKKEVEKYRKAKATLHFPIDEKLPAALIKKLVKAQVKKNDEKHI